MIETQEALFDQNRVDIQTVVIPAHADSGFHDTRSRSEQVRVSLRQHRLECLDGWLRLWLKPFATLLAIFAMGLALALPAGLYMVLENGRHLVQAWPMDNQISVYLQPELSDARARALMPSVASMPGVSGIEFVSKAEALEAFSDQSSFADTIRGLDENPLPALLELRVEEGLDEFGLSSLTDRLANLAGVDKVRVDAQWLQRLGSLVKVAHILLSLLSAALGVTLVLVVLSATRLAIQERQGEIAVKRLFGATRAHLKRPFLYMGAWLGFWASLLACLLSWMALGLLQQPLGALLSLYQADVGFHHLSGAAIMMIFLFGMGFAWLGAWLATRQDL